ncbi:N-acetyl sugar amidotransferase [Geomonas paludis]|uniref:N-acetyl sugar amidotransferase n=1 Tax=Geomonas paludis TaxID=2740185 RepID=A0ABY4LI14_9BACT|nr:N-acetyl sugar amidotransferase [Geomonas paludis]UPU37637.1 N-acetyl sugar amidotransferase [Geomonas paludis]
MTSNSSQKPHHVCTRCVMDTTDHEIIFDDAGVCNRCKEYETLLPRLLPKPQNRDRELRELVARIKEEGKGKEYDCLIGVSGGVDSTYVAYLVKNLGLRPLAVHLDNGWDTELAVSNIEKCMKALDIDLYTHVLDWDEFKDLQLAFLRASTPDSEFPTDHAIYALMIRKAAEIGTRYIISGVNLVTEGITGPKMTANAFDFKYIEGIHKRFGTRRLTGNFPRLTLANFIYYRLVRKQQLVYLLNYVDYNKKDAVELMKRELGWQPYTGKHHESVYTRFFQSYILPVKFGFDKRIMHLSALIMSGQMTREQALAELQKEVCAPELIREDKTYVAKKFGISEQELDDILAQPPRQNSEYPSSERTFLMRCYRLYQQRRTAAAQ